MQLFLALGVPAAFLLLVTSVWPQDESGTARKTYLRGLLCSVPILIGARILGAFVPEYFGSFLLSFHEWADRILPLAVLPGAFYAIFYNYQEKIHGGVAARRLTAFYAGALSPAGIAEIVRMGQSNDPHTLFLLPVLLGAIVLGMPVLANRIMSSWGAELAGNILALLVVTFTASLCPWLSLAQLWPIAWLLAAGLGLGAWFLAFPSLALRAPTQLNQ